MAFASVMITLAQTKVRTLNYSVNQKLELWVF